MNPTACCSNADYAYKQKISFPFAFALCGGCPPTHMGCPNVSVFYIRPVNGAKGYG